MLGYDTNLAAEYFIMSCLHRLGVTASLTLGNKKGVDILVAREVGDSVTVEVKGVAKRYDWPANNIKPKKPDGHFVVLVSFDGVIADENMPTPKVWVVPFPRLKKFLRHYKGRKGERTNVSRSAIFKEGHEFENAWHFIEPRLKKNGQ